MGVLLREVLRTLCVGNQWSYAVFWKIGCHNPRLLIWEDCYYEPLSDFDADKAGSPSGGSVQAGDNVGLLIYKMMNHNQFNIVGEGIVGRAAFTGNHEWILANGYIGNTNPPEVLNELHHQFSAGMQTVAVVPVSPHGVVQLGSSFSIMENVGFVNDVKSLILQLGCVPGALLSDGSSAVDSVVRTGVPISVEMLVPAQLPPPLYVSGNQQSINSDSLRIVGQPFQSVGLEAVDNRHYNASVSDVPKEIFSGVIGQSSKNCTSLPRLNSGNMNGAETTCLYDDSWGKKLPGTIDLRPGCSQEPEIGQPNGPIHISFPKQLIIEGTSSHSDGNNVDDAMKRGGSIFFSYDHKPTPGNQASRGQTNHMGPPSYFLPNSGRVANACAPVLEDVALSSLLDQLNTNGGMSGCADSICSLPAFGTPLASRDKIISMDHQIPSLARDCSKLATGSKSTVTANSNYENSCAQASLGDDLYDILGADYKSKLINERLNEAFRNEEGLHSDFSSASRGKSDGNIFSSTGTDHLLDAVVSRACSASKQSSSDGSSRKMFADSRGSQPMGGRLGLSDPGQKEMLDLPKYMEKAGTVTSGSWNNESNSCSIATSSYGSQLTSWISGSANQDSSISVGYPKKNDSTSKTPRKRLKPGENPRPRPKDRQLIQDRVKELREIVPHGAKCSIDALLERTIKHMLFLQSVTKHADKIKQTGDSKLISKDGRLLVNGNLEGGKTWAFEVGSHSTICPIIVEDLNPPRQLLVEMLCEERGFFLEIADLIRGMGLTILKGVMESRNGKIWAQFAVEADRDVTRGEVFISLVHLLEQVKSGMSSTSNMPENSHMMAHHTLHTATSIPATGRPGMLQ